MDDSTALLEQLNTCLLNDPDAIELLQDDGPPPAWLGYPPATPSEIAEAESRLGLALPPQYSAFLSLSNGWRLLDTLLGPLLPVSELEWFRKTDPDWIQAYVEPAGEVSLERHLQYGPDQDCAVFRTQFLYDCLRISQPNDGAVLLLNPAVQNPHQEWELWHFANWNPGAERYPSFNDFLRQTLAELQADAVERGRITAD